MRLCCVDKQKQQCLVTDTQTKHPSDVQLWSWKQLACQQVVWWVTHLAKSSAIPYREVWWENSFVSDTVGCICSPVSPQTQQASWRRPQILLWRELCVYQLWTFWLDSVKLLLPLWAEEVRPRIQLQNILPLPLHLISAFPPEKSQCSLAWYNNRVENKVRYAWLGVLPMFICSGLIFDFWNFLTVICQSLHHNFSKIVKP